MEYNVRYGEELKYMNPRQYSNCNNNTKNKNEKYTMINEIFLLVTIIGLMIAEIIGIHTKIWMEVVYISLLYLFSGIAIWSIKNNTADKSIVLIPTMIFFSYILIEMGVNIPINIVTIIVITVVLLFNNYKSKSGCKKVKTACVLILILGFLSLDYYIYMDNIIKDNGLYIHVKKENLIKGKIKESDLLNIKELSTPYDRNVNTLQGIENMKNIESIYIWDARKIEDYSYISQLSNLNKMVVWYGDLNKISKLDTMNSLETLGIIYPNEGEFQGLEAFPNLKVLDIEGGNIEINKLQGHKKIETIDIVSAKNINFEGIDKFPKLTTLNLTDIYIDNIDNMDEVLKSETLSIIELENCKFKDKDKDEFIQRVNDKGISVIEK
ncbi:hypothetical protein [Clostridium sp.]|uniref:hypothetical protein n=1 Tax=Clostridium sp. TaxID=1506 RepID=UPI003216E2B1